MINRAELRVDVIIENLDEIKAELEEINELLDKASSKVKELASKPVSINLEMKD